MVGTAMIGSPVSRATAFARPVAEPPPMLMIPSAPVSRAVVVAASAMCRGTCWTASRQWAAGVSRPAMVSATSWVPSVETSRGRVMPSCPA